MQPYCNITIYSRSNYRVENAKIIKNKMQNIRIATELQQKNKKHSYPHPLFKRRNTYQQKTDLKCPKSEAIAFIPPQILAGFN